MTDHGRADDLRDDLRDLRDAYDIAPGITEASDYSVRRAVLTYTVGFVLAVLLTVASFATLKTPLIWGPGIPVMLGAGCCGALPFHLGREDEAKAWAKRAIGAFERAGGSKSFEGILITATGCAAHIADYPHLFRDDPKWQARAQAFASKLMQLTDLSSPACGGGGSPRSGETEGASRKRILSTWVPHITV